MKKREKWKYEKNERKTKKWFKEISRTFPTPMDMKSGNRPIRNSVWAAFALGGLKINMKLEKMLVK